MKTLFVVLALAQLVPVWTPAYFATQDGPAHVYNAWALRELALGHDNAVTRAYEFDKRPNPNLLGHAILAILLGVFTPAVAEKILVSAIVLLFLGGAWMFAGAIDDGARVYAFFALPLAFHQLLLLGFYNFSLGVGLYLVIVALWWKRRDVAVAVLLVVCYFAHPLPAMFAFGSILVFWLTTRPPAKRLLALVPVLPLLDWYALQAIGKTGPTQWTALQRLTFLVRTEVIAAVIPGIALFALLVAVTIATIVVEPRRRVANAFLILLAAAVVLFAFAPAEAGGGGFVLQRIALFIVLLPLPWMSGRLPPFFRGVVVATLALLAIEQATVVTIEERRSARTTAALVDAARQIPPDRSFLPLIGERGPRGTFLQLYSHAASYAAVDRRLLDADNYEPVAGQFPLTFRAGAPHRIDYTTQLRPNDVDLDAWAPFAEYVFAWRLQRPPSTQRYTLIWSSPDARIYRRRE